jgi:hypothetical protein
VEQSCWEHQPGIFNSPVDAGACLGSQHGEFGSGHAHGGARTSGVWSSGGVVVTGQVPGFVVVRCAGWERWVEISASGGCAIENELEEFWEGISSDNVWVGV